MNLFWFKLSTNFDKDDRVLYVENEKNGDTAICCYIKLLCIAGRSNRGGAVCLADGIPHTLKTLSIQWSKTLESTRKALQLLEKVKLIEIEDGVIYISDWALVQSVDKLEEIRKQGRERQRKCRERKKQNVTLPSRDSHAVEKETEKEINKEKDKEEKENINGDSVCDTVKDFFNLTTTAFPKIKLLSDKQKASIEDTVKRFGFESVKYCFELAEQSDFLKGNNKQGWIASFDWLINPDNLVKVLNGNYSSVYSPPPIDEGHETSFESDEFIEAALTRGFED